MDSPPHALASLVRQLVQGVEQRWARVGHANADFAAIAADVLADVDPATHTDAMALINAVASGADAETYSGQHGSAQLIPLFANRRFFLALHAWPDEVGTPHCHAWSGAYQVLSGVSAHGFFSYEEEQRYDDKFGVGLLHRTSAAPVGRGDIVRVLPGLRMIHGMSYSDRLGISLSIRTLEPLDALTFEFLGSGVRIEGTTIDSLSQERLAVLAPLALASPIHAEDALVALIRSSDPRTAFFLLRAAQVGFRMLDQRRLLEAAGAVFGARLPVIESALQSWMREQVLREVRPMLQSDAQRQLLAALHLAKDRAELERVLSGVTPDAPAFIQRIAVELASLPGPRGLSLLGTPLGEDFDAILALLLVDARPESVVQRMAESYELGAQERETIRTASDTLRRLPLVQPLLGGRVS